MRRLDLSERPINKQAIVKQLLGARAARTSLDKKPTAKEYQILFHIS